MNGCQYDFVMRFRARAVIPPEAGCLVWFCGANQFLEVRAERLDGAPMVRLRETPP